MLLLEGVRAEQRTQHTLNHGSKTTSNDMTQSLPLMRGFDRSQVSRQRQSVRYLGADITVPVACMFGGSRAQQPEGAVFAGGPGRQ
jgi:hypothetical protein